MKTWDYHKVDTAYQRANRWLAVKITDAVGTMTCAYVFTALALVSLPDALKTTFTTVQWVAQTFLQLVLLSVIIVGQNVAAAASDARIVKLLADVEKILSVLDTNQPGDEEAVMAVTKERQ